MNELNPASLAAPAATQDDAKARVKAQATEAAVKFEAFFIKQMLSQMRSGARVLSDEDSAQNKRVNQDMLEMADGFVADSIAQQRAFGIADMMLKQVLPAAGLSPAPVASPSSTESMVKGKSQ